MSEQQRSDECRLVITDITPTHPHGFGGHEFEYEPADDLFRCVQCGKYEVVLREPDGSIRECPNSRPATEDAEALDASHHEAEHGEEASW